MKILCIHHTDLDGSASACVVGLKHKDDEVTYRYYNYGWPLEINELQGYDLIYAVDISFHQGFPWVYSMPGLIWIDHHKTALEFEAENPWMSRIPGLRKIGKGACELTWEYLFPGIECPDLIKYLSTYDVWDKTRYSWEMIEEIEFGAKHMFGINPLNLKAYLESGGGADKLRETGRLILGYFEKQAKSKLKSNGFYLPNFFGLRTLALNTPDFTSMSFMMYYTPEYFDLMLPFTIIPDDLRPGEFYVRCSLYSENPGVDVSEIAKRFGGGGHKGAAGFTTSVQDMMEILKTGRSLKKYLDEIKYKGKDPRV